MKHLLPIFFPDSGSRFSPGQRRKACEIRNSFPRREKCVEIRPPNLCLRRRGYLSFDRCEEREDFLPPLSNQRSPHPPSHSPPPQLCLCVCCGLVTLSLPSLSLSLSLPLSLPSATLFFIFRRQRSRTEQRSGEDQSNSSGSNNMPAFFLSLIGATAFCFDQQTGGKVRTERPLQFCFIRPCCVQSVSYMCILFYLRRDHSPGAESESLLGL